VAYKKGETYLEQIIEIRTKRKNLATRRSVTASQISSLTEVLRAAARGPCGGQI
jgi:hypothetical protein